jgi:hypothetical protein
MLATTLFFSSAVVWAADDDAAERARLNQLKAQADARLAEKQLECRDRFAVNDCLLDLRKEHRAVVDPIRKQLMVLDDKDRKRRAAERLERTRNKVETQAAAASAAQAAAGSTPAVARPAGAGASSTSLVLPKIRSAASGNGSVAADAASAGLPAASSVMPPAVQKVDKPITPKAATPQPGSEGYHSLRAREAEARREAVLKKNAERDSKKPPAQPLPTPAP